ncbi:2,3,4,5-tetrahydropyridine-2,6-carboxylate N-succinyltransferase [Halogeometricum borinquense DSM 11551]|uniref:2,3,4,5-tetrahydropyridine-2,6-carboxylate N-succinyltransferase n=2 Tax=Halogeometricum borinquense TaxID=60847 RepID=E4NQH6_HALBP|nr:2,3,4,5-tetrahydropyridine-2,6-dicarboxylate N-succinyltransferase [Halogeometricum borinquense]ADQ67849.1 2,3,4,5-tetrahydropyridine-2,6-dicarboxylate N-succinyltransferase [Halogeometricum borinquense DSM 11551]ELY23469.1 2,3,4,5-tetrahydropyridine-2,6-carboxylate N-succinyltransferase [Halogeometricum borinquense DSM 11551]RYJ14607.1 2,3,4,5-tetrahydropyridine-2,6-dicarboxylate N-succinyltransferase [Halogeometricum borinquense]
MSIQSEIDDLWQRYQDDDIDAATAGSETLATLDAFLVSLEQGEVRAAEQVGDSGPDGWVVNEWVKRGILLNFGLRETIGRDYGGTTYYDVLPLRDTADLGTRGTRNTPDGTTIRRGAFLGSDCIMMSPSFVNIGAYVGDGTLVDSCDTVGSCAQLGQNVKLGANTLIGGVLEPVEDAPVIIEDGVSLGAGCRVTSGFHVGENTIVGENTLLSPRIPVYDLVAEEVLYGHLPSNRRAFTRYVESSIGDHEIFAGGAYKPAVVALDIEEDTLDKTRREEALRE